MPMPAPPGDASASGRNPCRFGAREGALAGSSRSQSVTATYLLADYPAATNTGAMKTDTSVETPLAPGDRNAIPV